MERLLIVSNRLPVSVEKRKGIVHYNDSVGGVATGLSAFHKSHHSMWIGWPGISTEKIEKEKKSIEKKLISEYNCHPVFLTHTSVEKYYHGFSNRTIWPLFHYFTQYAIYDRNLWEEYEQVNKLFCDAVSEVTEKGDIIWVHDYHLMLLPSLLRERFPDATIGLFFHIPFPSSELFRLLPQRKEILDGLLGADLIGFHTYDCVNHFLSSVRRLSGSEHSYGQISVGDRIVRVDSFPMGIDYARFSEAVQDRNVKREMAKYLKKLGKHRVILSIDRLDYTKGITQRLEAFSIFLDRNPEYRGEVTLVLVAVPSRTQVETYRLLKKQVDELVGRINGEYATIDWTPIWYIYRSLPFTSLASLYSIADVCLVTPLRDGMNLIAKEYVATRKSGKGVLILSEMAGASKELGEAIIINANNKTEIADALKQALTMPESEQTDRNKTMQERLRRYDVARWAQDFVDRLLDTKKLQKELHAKRLSKVMRAKLKSDYDRSKRRLFLLDYDGTLIPFRERPEEAKPDRGLLALLQNLANDQKNEVVIISGRDRNSLQNWFGKLDLGLVSEHGAWTKGKKEEWKTIEPLTDEWKDKIRPLLELHVDRTPGAFIEEKEFSIAWHYRRADPEIGATRAGELIDNLLNLATDLNLQVLRGSKVIDIKIAGVSKERAAAQWIEKEEWEFVLAAGDDWTDEDIFTALPDDAYSIKVGFTPSIAKYNLDSPGEVVLLLGELITDSPLKS